MLPASNQQFKNKAGFTLIELLIVIAVIGILSGMVMVSFDGARDKARIAKSLQFSNSVQNAIGVDMVGRWNFEKIEEGKVIDTSGYGNDGVVHGATLVPGLEQLGNALSFDGNDWVDCGNDESLNITNAITIEAWVKLASMPNASSYCTIVAKGAGSMTSYWMDIRNGGAILFGGYTSEGGNCYQDTGIKITNVNQWYHIVGTYDQKVSKVYIDGRLVTSVTKTCVLRTNNDNVTIGARFNSIFFNGLLDDIRVYNAALSSSAIREHYLAGLDKLLARGQITEDDYQQRIAELNSNYVARK